MLDAEPVMDIMAGLRSPRDAYAQAKGAFVLAVVELARARVPGPDGVPLV